IPRKNKISLSPAIQIISIGIVAIGIFSVAEIVGFSINAERTPDERRILIIISFAILVMMTAIILLFDKMGSAIWKKLDAEHRLQLFTMEEANIKRSKEMIRTWNHDFKNALEILRYYAVRGDLENIKKYIGILQSGYEEIKAEQSTGYSSVDAIISMKLMVAHTKEIPISLNISQIDNLPINESDFSMILGNLLDNAIEACEKVEIPDNRYI
ncbi:GHKL domain-containing protein, partial [Christensenella hongkongensis]